MERQLRNHTRLQASHPGSDQVDDSTDICLELKAEGPQHEGDIAVQGLGGMLLMTEFSRVCGVVVCTLRRTIRLPEPPQGCRETFPGEGRWLFEACAGAA